MKTIRRLTIIFSIVLFSVLALWFVSDHKGDYSLDNEEMEQTTVTAMDEILAEDLSLTIQMFLHQIEDELLRWSEKDLSESEIEEEMSQQLDEHTHINGFALINSTGEYSTIGEMIDNPSEKLLYPYKRKLSLSDPFINKGQKRMLLAINGDEETFVAEVDLSFIEGFIKEIASVSDNSGHFFIGENIDVTFSEEEVELPYVSKEVPELGWHLYVHSEEGEEEELHYKQGEVIVELFETVDKSTLVEQHRLKIVGEFNNKIIMRANDRTTEELISDLESDPHVAMVEPNYMFSKQLQYRNRVRPHMQRMEHNETIDKPNDEFYEPYQWNLTQIFAEDAWNVSVGRTAVPIAIVDSGIDPEHFDLAEKIMDGYNAFENNSAFEDEHGHGTHVAGIASAITNNHDGVAGVSWHNPILAVKALDHNAEGSSLSIAKGIVWAVDQGAKVINLSLGDSHDSNIMYEAIKYAYDQDVVLIAASGNDNVDTPMYPAAYDEVLTVAAVDAFRERAVFSNFGNHIDVSAPGEHIPSTYLGNQYVMMSGTSMAAPHVAGMAGLIRSVNPSLTNEEVYDIIKKSCDDLGESGYDPYFGHGEINLRKALEELL
ncbi:S8 family peptidase [Evansella cellulosilytica]|uniref:Peptidase S8 and S53 subtilisin kexin sedolisin n=1 Tax=Evansella cellulosilytica (strain ATCC 21833 / DSM 2522 / FERM P-1141 / JCM 9156 / N-4) TaxID=649639 RepID=E6U091_EVAC2|nr:S8 family peptidase [Evansella cellulosilytica]ADU30207.1 peptidase S8 and S53 subtilisin kexin sedolisin [Evansella cellulosilytica DSM 2522]